MATQSDHAHVDAIVDLLLTIGYIDGRLHQGEADFIRGYLDRLIDHVGGPTGTGDSLRARVGACYARLEAEIGALGAEVVSAGDEHYPRTRLKVRAVSLFRGFSPADQKVALDLLDAVIRTDGTVSPQEHELHAELLSYFHAPPSLPAPTLLPPNQGAADLPLLDAPRTLELAVRSHPLLDSLEHPYAADPAALHAQLHSDYALIFSAISTWERQRARGNGRLVGITDVAQLPPGSRILDDRVYVLRPDRPTELIVLGDLHGCYSCLKAALLQSRFIDRVQAYQLDPANNPDIKLVLLGDYIDRGRFSFEGVLRTVLQLLTTFPDHVIALRGNHEFLVRRGEQIASGVNPAEALPALATRAPVDLLEAYRHLFEHMPTSCLAERTVFVHAGIPRDETLAARFRDLSSLNDPVVRFETMWSDPAATDVVPTALQRESPRFSFGALQFSQFMARIGCHTLIRGHEQVDGGFSTAFRLPTCRLHTLFSCGGRDNTDLPADSRYRGVTPMALTIRMGTGATRLTPWPIDYGPFCAATHNGHYR